MIGGKRPNDRLDHFWNNDLAAFCLAVWAFPSQKPVATIDEEDPNVSSPVVSLAAVWAPGNHDKIIEPTQTVHLFLLSTDIN
ncbi:hypothetical protein A2797_00610 [candidate division WWE3 bacterium RIFCSPHIGHO2_01_FULL_48_15]|uniref:Uncharacterized protein n=1 Tax=candidate division WWE3 bacterium RIFCSPHIGHO2_01_FULL_48_15 TaxID=1802619 RepID=A0A1F4VB95_UNCKA|nr:MAG: hypothetical protein A2797_00610 [candidate division WWE3 bacterium RIFCSPHIGHO2_01_FULL_48_15]